jgi:hypothetical protein
MEAKASSVPDRTWAVVAFGVGAAGLVGAATFGALALHEKHGLEDDPRCGGGLCPNEPHYADAESRLRTFSDLATVGLSVAVVGAAVGTTLWITRTPSRVPTAGVVPYVGVGSAGVRGSF